MAYSLFVHCGLKIGGLKKIGDETSLSVLSDICKASLINKLVVLTTQRLPWLHTSWRANGYERINWHYQVEKAPFGTNFL